MNLIKYLPVSKGLVTLRLAEPSDAAFIVALRTDERLSKYISKTNDDVDAQRRWLESYKEREAKGLEYYFIAVNSESGEQLGTSRLYNLAAESFEVGSWVFKADQNSSCAILTDIMVREIGFSLLNYEVCKFQVRKDNKVVIRYHLGYKPELIDEDDDTLYYQLSKDGFYKYSRKILNIFGYGSE